MERRIGDAKDLHEKLKRECEATADLLNTLLQTSASHLESLSELKSNEYRTNLKYFLTVSHFQHDAHQKLAELNVDLEEYLLDNQLRNYERFKEESLSSRVYKNSEGSTVTTCSPTVSVSKSNYDLKLKPTVDLIALSPTNELSRRSSQDKSVSSLESSTICEARPCSRPQANSSHNFHGELKEPCLSEYNCITRNPVETSSILNDSVSSSTDVYFDLQDEIDYDDDDLHTLNAEVGQINKPTQEIHTPVAVSEIYKTLNSEQLNNLPGVAFQENYEDEFDYDDLHTSNANNLQEQEIQTPVAVSQISDRLSNLPSIAFQEKYFKPLHNPSMPNISLQSSDIKRYTIVDEVSDVKETDPHISTKKGKRSSKKCTFKDDVKTNASGNAVYEIEHRASAFTGDICMIGFMKSPSNFYIQICDENSALVDVLEKQLAEINSNTSVFCSTKQETFNELGKFCTLAIDGVWYRAEVLDWLQNSSSDQVYVQLIDYGCEYSVSYKTLRPLPAFCRSYRLAQKCYLAYLYPPGSSKDNKLSQWPVACKEAFFNYCDDLDKSVFRITYIQPSKLEPNAYEIDIVKVGDDCDDKSIGEILLEAGLAVQVIDDFQEVLKHDEMRNQILSAHGIAGVNSGMTREEVLDIYFQEVDEEPSDINEAVMKYNPRDEAETCRNLRPDGTCYKGAQCKWRHKVLKSGYTNDKVAIYSSAFSELFLPQSGSDIELTISHIVDIQCFYAQIKNTSNGITSSINDLINKMNEPQIIKQYTALEQMPSPTEIVIAQYWNQFWYRAQIRDVSDSNWKTAQAEVYFVDFGDIERTAVSDLRNIMPEFLQLPFQAVECRLHNLKHKEDANMDIEKKYLESKLLGRTVKAHVVAAPGHLQVLLKNNNGQDVGLQMIEEGIGELNTDHNFPADSEMILID